MLDLSKATALSLAAAVPSLSHSQLRWEFANIAAAITLLSVALIAIALFFFRRKTRELTLIYFSLLLILYAVRLLANFSPLFRSLFGASQTFWVYLDWTITYIITIPLTLFLLQVAGGRFRTFFRWLLAVQIAFVLFGIGAAALGVRLAKLHFANSIMVLGTLVAAALFAAIRKRTLGSSFVVSRDVRVFLAGFAVWILFIVHANLLGLGVLKGQNVEFVGFLIFVGTLGYISAHRVFANEERLLTINKELEIARRIQSSIIPQSVPRLTELEVAARYAPMSAVAGDFYDFLPVDDKRLGILVADVTGHGIPAALIASMLKVAFAGQAAHAHDPARLLSGLNSTLCGKFEEHFVTAAYLFVDLENRLLRYAAAGHPPLMLTSGNAAKVQEIEHNGLMLGMFPEAIYTFTERGFVPGDRCLLYTDGVFEARNFGQEEFGKGRLAEFLEAHKNVPPDGVADALLEEITRWSAASPNSANPLQNDDITLVILDFPSTGSADQPATN